MSDEQARKGLAYSIPLRGFMAQLVLPYDLTAEEAERLGAVIRTLAVESHTNAEKEG